MVKKCGTNAHKKQISNHVSKIINYFVLFCTDLCRAPYDDWKRKGTKVPIILYS
jgi:hypothetical protein